MIRIYFTLIIAILLAGCREAELPPVNLSDNVVDFTIVKPEGFENWQKDNQQKYVLLTNEIKASKSKFEGDIKQLNSSYLTINTKLKKSINNLENSLTLWELTESDGDNKQKKNQLFQDSLNLIQVQLLSNDQQYHSDYRTLLDAFKNLIFQQQIELDKLLPTILKGGEKENDGDDPRDTVPPVVYGEVIDPNTLNGYEVFINIGGVAGSSLEQTAKNALVDGYKKLGFHVNLITGAMSWKPIKSRMKYVASVYRTNNIELKYVVFHHGGHGWKDKISYESTARDSLGIFTRKRGVSTPHDTIFIDLGAIFPKSVAQFPNTVFGVVLDACGQGNAADRKVAGRHGFVATCTPAFSWYHGKWIKGNHYSGTYIYSNYFGNYLKNIDSVDEPHVKTEVLRNAHNHANSQCKLSQMGDGRYEAY